MERMIVNDFDHTCGICCSWTTATVCPLVAVLTGGSELISMLRCSDSHDDVDVKRNVCVSRISWSRSSLVVDFVPEKLFTKNSRNYVWISEILKPPVWHRPSFHCQSHSDQFTPVQWWWFKWWPGGGSAHICLNNIEIKCGYVSHWQVWLRAQSWHLDLSACFCQVLSCYLAVVFILALLCHLTPCVVIVPSPL